MRETLAANCATDRCADPQTVDNCTRVWKGLRGRMATGSATDRCAVSKTVSN